MVVDKLAKRNRVRVSPRRVRQMKSAPAKVPELVLAELAMTPLLRQLASLAVRFGITPREIGKILKFECASEAARVATLQNGRVNYSRVAVITGLSRTEAKRLLVAGAQSIHTPAVSHHRAWRLISAWLTDPQFLNHRSIPRPLRLGGGRNCFADLVKTYCGDVPAKAVLAELQRIGAIKISGENAILKQGVSRRLRRDIGSARGVLKATSYILEQVSRGQDTRPPMVKSATVSFASRADQAVIMQRIDATLTAALDAIQSLGERPTARGTRLKAPRPPSLDVSAIVTTRMRAPRAKD